MISLARAAMVKTRSMSRNLASTSFTKDFEIQDNPSESVLTMQINGDYAKVDYSRQGNLYDLIHSAVPDKFQGRGYGQLLAEKTFDYIVSNDFRMKLTCEFLTSFYEKNRDKYKRYVV
ncbi:hypothetical protein ILUMI_18152 [Ignelater luminosus]|uniref:Protein NATD1 n=1 Tax=Ignelater luminosus TaxID=2038154 RepID=A0A8K0CPP7_IGNLU|nr:hypothetical protein ILUMI_18152 [Ignelater luminosus]